jgi:hypothetical protein
MIVSPHRTLPIVVREHESSLVTGYSGHAVLFTNRESRMELKGRRGERGSAARSNSPAVTWGSVPQGAGPQPGHKMCVLGTTRCRSHYDFDVTHEVDISQSPSRPNQNLATLTICHVDNK